MTGAWRLCGLLLRRDWLRLLIWIALLGVFAAAVPMIFEGFFATEAERAAMAETVKIPAMTALFGIGYGIDHYTTGAMMAHELLLLTMMAVAVGNILLVVRHTRKVEELGRLEMILSLPVGRMANLTATLMAAALFNGLIFAEHVAIFTLLGIPSMPLLGSVTYGACLAVTGLVFSALTALIAQVAGSSRASMGLSFAAFGVLYMMRAVGDLGNETLSRLSPLGLLLRSKPFVDENPGPLLIGLGIAAALCVPAYLLQGWRDMDAGLLPQRPGRGAAGRGLRSALGLAWRLNRGMLLAWGMGMFLCGAMYGSVFGDMEGFLESSDFLRAIMTNMDFTLTEQFLAMLVTVFSLICMVPGLMLALRLRGEERGNRIEPLAARSVGRGEMMWAYVVLSLVSSVVTMAMISLGLWAASASVMAQPMGLGSVFAASFSYLPAMLVMSGLAFALIGWLPKVAGAVWAVLLYGFFAGYMGPLLRMPDWVGILSPFHYVRQLPVEAFSAVPVVAMCAVAAALLAAGFAGYRRRDLAG